MIAYLDSSVLLRVIFQEKKSLNEFHEISEAVSSDLLRVECFRTIDRIRKDKDLTEDTYLALVEHLFKYLERVEIIPINREILNRASQPFPTSLGTLDAIHLSSSILYRERFGRDLTICTHDISFFNAAKSIGFHCLGC